MAAGDLTHSAWFEFLKESMKATNEELEYLERLHELKSKQQVSEIKYKTADSPSMIIDDFLYHGELIHARKIELLRKLNIRHIITVCQYKLKKEILDNFNVLWINLQDIPAADISEYFDQTNEFLNMCRSKNEKVLVHCQMGVSRSSSIVLAYLLKYHHSTLHAAYDYLLERRQVAEPNDSFFIQLIRYEQDLSMNKVSDTTLTSTESINT